jgi:hypothetical protein
MNSEQSGFKVAFYQISDLHEQEDRYDIEAPSLLRNYHFSGS